MADPVKATNPDQQKNHSFRLEMFYAIFALLVLALVINVYAFMRAVEGPPTGAVRVWKHTPKTHIFATFVLVDEDKRPAGTFQMDHAQQELLLYDIPVGNYELTMLDGTCDPDYRAFPPEAALLPPTITCSYRPHWVTILANTVAEVQLEFDVTVHFNVNSSHEDTVPTPTIY